jgi:ectoine hydroxylase-related dioxygenase (phytanoyl-CoA dioxygenase family)
MEQTTPSEENYCQEIIKQVRKDGICILGDSLLSEDQLSFFLSTLDKLSKEDSDYKFGKAYNAGNVHDWNGTKITSLCNSPLLTGCIHEFFGKQIVAEIYFTHEYKNDEGLDRNAYLHFDRIPSLKFFIYLTDCLDESGAFHFVPGSHHLGRELRLKGQQNYLTDFDANRKDYDEKKNRLEVDFPELGFTKKDAIPLTGKAGTMFVFNTDMFHFGGEIKDGEERKVMRIHLRNTI